MQAKTQKLKHDRGESFSLPGWPNPLEGSPETIPVTFMPPQGLEEHFTGLFNLLKRPDNFFDNPWKLFMLLWNHPRGHFHILQVPRNFFCDPSPFQGQTRGISCTKRHLKHLPLLLNPTPASSRTTVTSPKALRPPPGPLGLPLRPGTLSSVQN